MIVNKLFPNLSQTTTIYVTIIDNSDSSSNKSWKKTIYCNNRNKSKGSDNMENETRLLLCSYGVYTEQNRADFRSWAKFVIATIARKFDYCWNTTEMTTTLQTKLKVCIMLMIGTRVWWHQIVKIAQRGNLNVESWVIREHRSIFTHTLAITLNRISPHPLQQRNFSFNLQ